MAQDHSTSEDKQYTLGQAADELGVTVSTLKRWLISTDIEPLTYGLDKRARVITGSDLEHLRRTFHHRLDDIRGNHDTVENATIDEIADEVDPESETQFTQQTDALTLSLQQITASLLDTAAELSKAAQEEIARGNVRGAMQATEMLKQVSDQARTVSEARQAAILLQRDHETVRWLIQNLPAVTLMCQEMIEVIETQSAISQVVRDAARRDFQIVQGVLDQLLAARDDVLPRPILDPIRHFLLQVRNYASRNRAVREVWELNTAFGNKLLEP